MLFSIICATTEADLVARFKLDDFKKGFLLTAIPEEKKTKFIKEIFSIISDKTGSSSELIGIADQIRSVFEDRSYIIETVKSITKGRSGSLKELDKVFDLVKRDPEMPQAFVENKEGSLAELIEVMHLIFRKPTADYTASTLKDIIDQMNSKLEMTSETANTSDSDVRTSGTKSNTSNASKNSKRPKWKA